MGQVSDIPLQFRFDLKSYIKGVQVSRKVAQENIKKNQKVNKANHDVSSDDTIYKLDDLVWMYNPEVPIGFSKKLRRVWLGPFKVIGIGPNNTYKLQNCENMQILGSLANAARLKHVIGEQMSAIRSMISQQGQSQGHRMGPNEPMSTKAGRRGK
jgi:hypothetical protein